MAEGVNKLDPGRVRVVEELGVEVGAVLDVLFRSGTQFRVAVDVAGC